MVVEIVFASLAGYFLGIVLGLLPGLHLNNVLPALLTLSFIFGSPLLLAIFIVSAAITQIFVGFIPSIFLGAPEEENALSVLPGHRLLLEGRGYEAIKLTVIGGIGSLIFGIVLIFLLKDAFSYIYDASRPYIHFLISGIAIFMIFSERKLKKILSALLVFMLSGIFGVIVLNCSVLSKENVLFPVLNGLFGLSLLVSSISEKSEIPIQQEESELKISKIKMMKSISLGAVAGILVGMLPAIGVSQAATLVQLGGGESRDFLVTVSGINIANEVFSLISLFLVNNPRSGSSVAIQTILGELSGWDVVMFVGVICFTSGLASVITIDLGKKIPKFLGRLNYKMISISIILFVSGLVFVFGSFPAILTLLTAISIGLTANYLGVRKSHCMGVLLMPSILFFAGLNPLIISILRI